MVLIKIEISFGKHIVQSVEKYGVLQSSKSDIVHGKIDFENQELEKLPRNPKTRDISIIIC